MGRPGSAGDPRLSVGSVQRADRQPRFGDLDLGSSAGSVPASALPAKYVGDDQPLGSGAELLGQEPVDPRAVGRQRRADLGSVVEAVVVPPAARCPCVARVQGRPRASAPVSTSERRVLTMAKGSQPLGGRCEAGRGPVRVYRRSRDWRYWAQLTRSLSWNKSEGPPWRNPGCSSLGQHRRAPSGRVAGTFVALPRKADWRVSWAPMTRGVQ